jgi:hypothetical protein
MTDMSLWLDRIQALAAERQRATEDYRRQLAWAGEAYDRKVAAITEREACILRMRTHQVVLVRTSIGAPMAVYHSATRPCKAARRSGFQRKLEGEVRRLRLKRCSHCYWSEAIESEKSA